MIKKQILVTVCCLLLFLVVGCGDGQGTINYDDGSVYIGEVKDSKANGMGTWKHPGGDEYVGEL